MKSIIVPPAVVITILTLAALVIGVIVIGGVVEASQVEPEYVYTGEKLPWLPGDPTA